MERKMRIELLLASPPTKKCLFLKDTFTKFITENSLLRLDIYYAGDSITISTTKGYKKTLDKRIKIPMIFINGNPVPKEYHTDISFLKSQITMELAKGEQQWQV